MHSNTELVCLRCGISPPTLYKWLGRYRQLGKEGLKSLSHRGEVHHQAKVTPQYESWNLELCKRRLGTRRLQSELIRQHDLKLSRATIHKILIKHQVKPIILRSTTKMELRIFKSNSKLQSVWLLASEREA